MTLSGSGPQSLKTGHAMADVRLRFIHGWFEQGPWSWLENMEDL